ncbi:hypothetical protein LEP1GSC081_0305 [Leptospira kirschneri str. H1]|uniref:Uncharacterized protein n=1 Tax=Leptospira kirschneri str. H1 TaxID=1049966 RepID=A0A0E2AZP8_9LEPT|nr:hypothetical protein LEP1GSC081_0305 [Leptospira kirschneri str. H1]
MLDTGFFTPPGFSIIFGVVDLCNSIQFSESSTCICLKYFNFFFLKNGMKINSSKKTKSSLEKLNHSKLCYSS